MVYYCWFSLRWNLDFIDKKFYNINYWIKKVFVASISSPSVVARCLPRSLVINITISWLTLGPSNKIPRNYTASIVLEGRRRRRGLISRPIIMIMKIAWQLVRHGTHKDAVVIDDVHAVAADADVVDATQSITNTTTLSSSSRWSIKHSAERERLLFSSIKCMLQRLQRIVKRFVCG